MQNKDLCSRLLQVRLVGIKFSGATAPGQTDSSTFILRVCNINGDRYVVSNDVPYCRLRIWDWAKSRNLRVYSLNDKKMLNVIPLHVVQQNRDKVDRALQAAGIEGIPSRYNHTVSEDQWRDSRQAQRAWDKVLHPHSYVCKPAVSVARPGLLRRILRFVGL